MRIWWIYKVMNRVDDGTRCVMYLEYVYGRLLVVSSCGVSVVVAIPGLVILHLVMKSYVLILDPMKPEKVLDHAICVYAKQVMLHELLGENRPAVDFFFALCSFFFLPTKQATPTL